jgi:hypothetical protein
MPEPIEVTKMKENCDNREYVLNNVKQNGKLLEFASEALKDDYEIASEAVKNNAEALEFVSDRLKGDRDIVYDSVSRLRLDILLCKTKFTFR